MRNQNSDARQGDAQNANPVGGALIATISGGFRHGSANLQSEGTGNGAWHVAGSNLLALLEPHDSKVLLGVTAMTMSGRSWGSPSQNLSELTLEGERESGVDILDGGNTDFVPSEWIHDHYALSTNADSGYDVVGKNNAQNQGNNGNAADTSLLAGVEALQAGDTTQDQTCNGNDITRGGSFHPEIVACKEQLNGNL